MSGKFDEIKFQLLDSWGYINKSLPLVNALPDILGFPEPSNYLVIFQNTDELRPSGGFIGSYAILQSKNASLKKITTADSYHLDMPVRNSLDVKANPVLNRYLKSEKMFLRDANWSPDWIQSAKNINFIYKEILKSWPEDKEKPFNEDFDFIIAITPDLVESLLEIVGPIDHKGKLYTANNFQAQLQKQVEIDYIEQGISSWERKSVISDLLEIIETRLLNLEQKNWPQLIYKITDQADKKNILIYAKDDYTQEIFKNLDWTGQVKTVAGDYIMVVDANMAALKTDALINRSMKYKAKIFNGNVESSLSLNYKHLGTEINWRTSKYHSYTRIYLPIDAENIEVSGFTSDSVKIYKDNELNKKVVAGYFTVLLDSEKSIVLNYETTNKDDNYNLYIQKQPGTNWKTKVNVNFNDNLNSFQPNFNSYHDLKNNNITWKGLLDKDQKYIINFK